MPIGFFVTYYGTKGILRLKAKSGNPAEFEKTCGKLLILSTFALQFSRWGNDVGNPAGVLFNLFDPLGARLITAVAMSFGLVILGRIVIGNVGGRMVTLTPSSALISEIVATPLIFIFAFSGIPLSGTHVMISAILGGGSALKTEIDTTLVRNFSIAWVLSFIVPGLLAMLFAFVSSSTGILSFK